jgi:hypothetical protein
VLLVQTVYSGFEVEKRELNDVQLSIKYEGNKSSTEAF